MIHTKLYAFNINTNNYRPQRSHFLHEMRNASYAPTDMFQGHEQETGMLIHRSACIDLCIVCRCCLLVILLPFCSCTIFGFALTPAIRRPTTAKKQHISKQQSMRQVYSINATLDVNLKVDGEDFNIYMYCFILLNNIIN